MMRVFETLKANESLLKILVLNGVRVADIEWLEMYDDYRRLMNEGHKKTYIVSYLEEQYGCPVPTIYRVVRRLERSLRI